MHHPEQYSLTTMSPLTYRPLIDVQKIIRPQTSHYCRWPKAWLSNLPRVLLVLSPVNRKYKTWAATVTLAMMTNTNSASQDCAPTSLDNGQCRQES